MGYFKDGMILLIVIIVFKLFNFIVVGFITLKYLLLTGVTYLPFAYLKRLSTTGLIVNLLHGTDIIRL